nr:alpha-glucosidase [Streptohalobacillus salinus]
MLIKGRLNLNKQWWKEAVVYQIYPRSFKDTNGDGVGDIKGIISKLDYLKDLGIDVIWVSPMYESPNDDNGYDISDYQAILPEFGSMKEFDELLEEVHARGMKLILDLVINHTSDEHPWFIESKSSKDSEKRDWYIWREGKNGKEPNNWESIFGGSIWEYDKESKQYYFHIFSKKQPDLNWKNREVRSELYDMINWWLEKGIDGFRVDAISHIHKTDFTDLPNPSEKQYVYSLERHMNVTGIHDYLSELKKETFDNYDIMTVGEANGVKVEDEQDLDQWIGEENGAFNMVFQFEHMELWDPKNKAEFDLVAFKKILSKWQKALENKGWNALFIENHDQPRKVSVWGNDKVYWYESATALATVYFLMQGTPFIYQGQEIGMTNVKFPSIDDYNDIADKNMYKNKVKEGVDASELMELIWLTSRDNSRTPMQWSDDTYAGFSKVHPWLNVNPNYKEINVNDQLKDSNSILNFYKKLIKLKKSREVFTYGSYQLYLENHPNMFVYSRTLEDTISVVMVNLTEEVVKIQQPAILTEERELLLSNYPSKEESIPWTFKPFEARVYMMRNNRRG